MSFPQVLTGVAHIGIPTNDLDKTIAFYKKLGFVSALETVNKAAGERVAFLQLGDLMIETYENHRAAEKAGAIDHVALATTDIEAAFAAAKEAGMDLVSGRYTIDAKSLLGIYSLDLSNPLTLVIYSDSCEELLTQLHALLPDCIV